MSESKLNRKFKKGSFAGRNGEKIIISDSAKEEFCKEMDDNLKANLEEFMWLRTIPYLIKKFIYDLSNKEKENKNVRKTTS